MTLTGPITFTITNEFTAIPVLQAAAAVYVRSAGIEDEIARQTELVIEEIVTNIIQYEYLPGQRETMTLTLSVQENVLEVLIRFKGIPFDVEYLRQCENTTMSEVIDSGGRGIGLQLLRRFSDNIHYRNLGWKGQEVCIRRFVHEPEGVASRQSEGRREEELSLAPQHIAVRRMHPEEAAAISQLAYFSYKYTYFNEYLYDPEEVRKRNEDGRLASYVAVNEGDGTMIGHLAVIPDDLSGIPELGAGFVNPRYRQSGAFNMLVDTIRTALKQQGIQGCFGTAVTSHPYSQRSAVRMGYKETGLFVSRLLPMAFQSITDRDVFRESLLYMALLFDASPRRPYYVPARHRGIIEKIVRNANMNVTFAEDPVENTLPALGEMEERTDANQTGHISLRHWGGDSPERVRRLVRRWCLDRMETIYLYLPIFEQATASLCDPFEGMGFFFVGLKLGGEGKDWLILQYLNNQRYDYGMLKAASPFGRELIDYVRACDPSQTDGD